MVETTWTSRAVFLLFCIPVAGDPGLLAQAQLHPRVQRWKTTYEASG